MTYKKKVYILVSLVITLLFIYILSFVLDPGKRKGNFFALLDSSLLVMADRLEIESSRGTVILERKNNIWSFSTESADLPVKQGRVEDFLAVLSRKEMYSPRASSNEARERLGLLEENATRIIVRGGAGFPLLDLLIGSGDALGREVYLQRTGRNEIFSVEDYLTFYTDDEPSSWFDLRLFPLSGTQKGAGENLNMVQQVDVVIPGSDSYVLRRSRNDGSGTDWIVQGEESSALDNPKVETWIRSILWAEADNFGFVPPNVIEGSIILRMGDGTDRAIYAGPEYDSCRNAVISGSDMVYILSEWTLNRLFREKSFFLK